MAGSVPAILLCGLPLDRWSPTGPSCAHS